MVFALICGGLIAAFMAAKRFGAAGAHFAVQTGHAGALEMLKEPSKALHAPSGLVQIATHDREEEEVGA